MKSVKNEADSVKKEKFLEAFRLCGSICQAAKAAEVSRQFHYGLLQTDADYPAEFAAAKEEARDALVREARRRAVTGVTKPVFYKGEECGAISEYSDTLLMFLIKGEWPEKYRDNVQHDHRYPDGKPDVVITIVQDSAAREARIDELIAKRSSGTPVTA